MSKENPQIDTIFKQAFENAQVPPPVSAFAAIQSHTLVGGTKTTLASWTGLKLIGVAFATVIIAVTGVIVYQNTQENQIDSNDSGVTTSMNLIDTVQRVNQGNNNGVSIQSKSEFSEKNTRKPEHLQQQHSSNNPSILSESNLSNMGANQKVVGSALEKSDKRGLSGMQTTGVSQMQTIANKENLGKEKFHQSVPNASNWLNGESTSKTSPETAQRKGLNAVKNNPCKNRFKVELDPDVIGPQEWAFKLSGDMAKYEWGTGDLKLGASLGQTWDWKGPAYVKKSQELQFWFRSHFIDGCRDTQWLQRWVSPQFQGFEELIPTVFTPNNDGYNDSFYVQMGEPFEYHVIIRDARGKPVFESENFREKWSGKVGTQRCESGVYRVWLQRRYWGDKEAEVKTFNLELR